MKRRKFSQVAVAVCVCFLSMQTVGNAQEEGAKSPDQVGGALPFNTYGPFYDDNGEVLRPVGWRRWVYVGTPLTPDDMNGGEANFREFHNVYIDPHSFEVFSETGEFPNGTQLVKEMVLVGSKEASSGSGYFMGDFYGLELTIKDTVRYKDEPGGWAYFSFGHTTFDKYAKTAKALPAAACNSCHESSADTDWVFTQYYPVLRAAMPSHKAEANTAARVEGKKMDENALKAAMGAVGGQSDGVKHDEYSDKLFAWLKTGAYKKFKAESAVHPSSAFSSHGDVRIFVNEKLAASMEAGGKEHPVGSVAVKELYKDGGLIGWATAVKAKEGAKGNGWHWYENTSTENNDKPVAAALGAGKCVGCHSAGNDFIRVKSIK
jgi:cytochrome c553